jgi:hypothetical protein
VRVSRPFMLVAAVLTLGGCQTLTEELPTQPEPPPVQIPVLPPPVVPIPIPPPEQPSNPAPPPSDPTGGGPPGQLPDNTNPVAKVGAKVFFVECDGVMVPDSEFATSVQVGCRIHFDCTPKDQFNDPTQAKSAPNWSFSPGDLLAGGNPNDFTPTPTVVGAGNLTVYVVIDGVTSNTLNISTYY